MQEPLFVSRDDSPSLCPGLAFFDPDLRVPLDLNWSGDTVRV